MTNEQKPPPYPVSVNVPPRQPQVLPPKRSSNSGGGKLIWISVIIVLFVALIIGMSQQSDKNIKKRDMAEAKAEAKAKVKAEAEEKKINGLSVNEFLAQRERLKCLTDLMRYKIIEDVEVNDERIIFFVNESWSNLTIRNRYAYLSNIRTYFSIFKNNKDFYIDLTDNNNKRSYGYYYADGFKYHHIKYD